METIRKYVLDRYANDDTVCGVCLVHGGANRMVLDGFDMLILVIQRPTADAGLPYMSHYIKDQTRIQERCLSSEQLEQTVLYGANRSAIQWILQGEIVVDRHLYVSSLRQRLEQFPAPMRQTKLLIEFGHFLQSFMQGKHDLREGHVLDAYSNILDALRHWARIVIIEKGMHPETLVWDQVRAMNPGVYKFYEELTSNNETLEQRTQLVVLACEFSVMSKMESCCRLLLDILRKSDAAWSTQQLQEQLQLNDTDVNLPLLLNKLARKSLIREVMEATKQEEQVMLELKYASNRPS